MPIRRQKTLHRVAAESALALALLMGSLWMCWPFLHDYFVWNDPRYVNGAARALRGEGSIFAPINGHLHFSFLFLYQIILRMFGAEPFYFHSANAVLHALNAWLLFHVVNYFFSDRWLAAFTSAAFVLAANHLEGYYYISSACHLLAVLGGLASLWFFLSWVDERAGLWSFLASLVCFAFGLGAKQSPLVLIIWFPFLVWRRRKDYKVALLCCLPFVAIAALYMVFLFFAPHFGLTEEFLEAARPQFGRNMIRVWSILGASLTTQFFFRATESQILLSLLSLLVVGFILYEAQRLGREKAGKIQGTLGLFFLILTPLLGLPYGGALLEDRFYYYGNLTFFLLVFLLMRGFLSKARFRNVGIVFLVCWALWQVRLGRLYIADLQLKLKPQINRRLADDLALHRELIAKAGQVTLIDFPRTKVWGLLYDSTSLTRLLTGTQVVAPLAAVESMPQGRAIHWEGSGGSMTTGVPGFRVISYQRDTADLFVAPEILDRPELWVYWDRAQDLVYYAWAPTVR